MLAWIAAHTTRIKVASWVLAAPFRCPAMVVKLAASLDQLSGGRLLGLGGGYSDSEVAAIGAPELSPAAKITGLAETVEILRGARSQAGFSLTGTQYRVSDLEMQPRPARPVPVWLGTSGPRALAVTGRLADGWIPSLSYVPAERFPALRQLRALLDLGFSGFNFMVGGPDQAAGMKRMAEEVLPALRSGS